MADQVIRVGMMGLGNWARYGHLPALTRLPNYMLTAVGDIWAQASGGRL